MPIYISKLMSEDTDIFSCCELKTIEQLKQEFDTITAYSHVRVGQEDITSVLNAIGETYGNVKDAIAGMLKYVHVKLTKIHNGMTGKEAEVDKLMERLSNYSGNKSETLELEKNVPNITKTRELMRKCCTLKGLSSIDDEDLKDLKNYTQRKVKVSEMEAFTKEAKEMFTHVKSYSVDVIADGVGLTKVMSKFGGASGGDINKLTSEARYKHHTCLDIIEILWNICVLIFGIIATFISILGEL